MHKPLWSYILSAGRFLSFDITKEIRFFTPSHMDHRNSSVDTVIRIPLRRVRIHVQPPAIRTEFPLVCIYTYNYDLSDLASGDV